MGPRKRNAPAKDGEGGRPARKQRTAPPPDQETGSRAPIPAPEPEIPTPNTTRQITGRGRMVLSDLGFEEDCELVKQVEGGQSTLAHLLTSHLDSSVAHDHTVTQEAMPALHAAMLPIRRGRGDDLTKAAPDRSPPLLPHAHTIGVAVQVRAMVGWRCWCVRR